MDYNILPSVLHIEISSILLLKISHFHLCNIDGFCPTEKKTGKINLTHKA